MKEMISYPLGVGLNMVGIIFRAVSRAFGDFGEDVGASHLLLFTSTRSPGQSSLLFPTKNLLN